MLGLGNRRTMLSNGFKKIVTAGLQLYYKATNTQAPLGEEQVRNNSFDEISGNLVSNPTFNLGSEEVDNEDYSNGLTGWSTQIPSGQVVEVVSNQLHINYDTSGTQQSTGVNQTILDANKKYQIEVDIESITGTIRIQAGGIVNDFSTVGVKTFIVEPTSSILYIIRFNNSTNVDVVINSISVKEVPSWELGDGWSIVDGKAVNNGDTGSNNLTQGSVLTSNKSYQITIEVSDYVSGNVQVSAGGVPRGTMTANGTYTFNQVASGGNFYIVANSFVGSVDNVFVKQIDPNNRWTVNNDTPSEQTVEIREGSFFIEYDSTATKGTANINVNSAGIVNQKYEIKVVVDSINNDKKLKVQLGNSPHNLSVGTNIFQATSTTSGTLTLGRTHENDSVTATVSSVSLRAITNSIKDHSKNPNDGTLYSGKALDFDGTGDIVELNDANLPGEFAVCTWVKPDTFTNCVVFGDGRDENNAYLNLNWIRLNSPTSITVKINGTSTHYVDLIHGGNIAQDKWSRLIVTRDSDNVIKFGINGVFYSPSNQARAGNFNFNLLGRKQDTEMNGALADVQVYDKAWNATDVKYDWENPDKDVFDRVDEVQVLGEELVDNGDFSDNTAGWSPFFNASLTVDNQRLAITPTTSSSSRATQGFTTQIGKTYIVNADFDNPNSSTVLIGLSPNSDGGGATYDTSTQSNDSINVLYTATTTTTYVSLSRLVNDTKTIYYDNVSVKEITTHASHILPTDCKSLLRLNEGAGDRVYDAAPVLRGDEEVQNGTFELGEELNDLSWLANGDWSTDGDIASNNGGSTLTNDILELGKTYQFKCKLSSYTSGEFSLYLGGGNESSRFSGTDEFTFIGVCTGDTNARVKAHGSDGSLLISSLTIKEIPNWTLRNNTTIVDGIANVVAGGNIGGLTDYWSLESLANVFEPSKTYQIKFKAKQVSLAGSNAGAFQVGNSYGALFDEVITSEFVDYTFIAQASSSNWPKLTIGGRIAGDVFQIDDISVKEIKPAESFAIVGDKNFIHQQPYIPQYAMSSFSKKMFFDGSNDYVACGSDASIDNIFTGGGTLSTWFSAESDGAGSVGTIISKTRFRLRTINESGGGVVIQFFADFDSSNGSWTTDSVVLLNKLNHIAVAYNGSSSSSNPLIYVNGANVAISEVVAPSGTIVSDESDNLTIGNVNPSGPHSYDGIIDEVSLFKTVLTQDEVLELYNSGSSFDSTGHSKYNLGEEVSNGTFDLGSEEVVNGDFATDSDWSEGTGWDIDEANNKATHTGAGGIIKQTFSNLIVGRHYVASVTLNSIGDTTLSNTSFQIRNSADNGSIAQLLSQNGGILADEINYLTLNFTATQVNNIIRVYSADNIFVTDFSVKEIPNWSSSTASSATISVNTSGQLELASDSSEYLGAYTPISLVEGRTYVLSVDIISSNKLSRIRIGTSNSVGSTSFVDIFSAFESGMTLGTSTHTFTATSAQASNGFLYIGGRDDVNSLVIDNVSLQEYGLSGYWRNNGADQWDDLSINSNHGTVSGSPTEIFLQEVPFFSKDSLGMFMNKPRLGGLNFNGSGYVANESMPTISDNISFSFWIKLEGFVATNLAQIVGKRTNGDSAWCRVYRSSVNTLRLEVTGSERLDFTIPEAEWVHVVTTIDDKEAKAYVNGSLLEETTLGVDFKFLSANDFSVGAWKDTATSTSITSLLNGVVDDVMVYDETLTLKQVKKNYNATKSKHKN